MNKDQRLTRLLLATSNRGKEEEMRQLLAPAGDLDVLSLADFGEEFSFEEKGFTYRDNAVEKALRAAQWSGLWTLADDSGLEVDALKGAPGIRSARFSSRGSDKEDLISALFEALSKVDSSQRLACFRCVLALARPAQDDVAGARLVKTTEGVCQGRILEKPVGEGGFGYDSVFFSDACGCAFAQAPMALKNSVSHRFAAMEEMMPLIKSLVG